MSVPLRPAWSAGDALPLTDPDAFGSAEVAVQPGDVLVFTSDGIEEARDTDGEFYGSERLVQVIQGAAADGGADTVRDAVVQDVQAFIGDAAQGDDLTVVVLKVEQTNA